MEKKLGKNLVSIEYSSDLYNNKAIATLKWKNKNYEIDKIIEIFRNTKGIKPETLDIVYSQDPNVTKISYSLSSEYDYLFYKSPELYRRNITSKGKNILHSKFGGLTSEQILNSPLCFLEHRTSEKYLAEIFRRGYIGTYYDTGIKTTAITPPKKVPGDRFKDFPGVYFYPRNQKYIRNYWEYEKNEYSLSGTYRFIFSLAILQQGNYHYNSKDIFGKITNATFSPKKLAEYMDKIEVFYGEYLYNGEVVVHDKIPLELCEAIIVYSPESKRKIEGYKSGIKIYMLDDNESFTRNLVDQQFVKHLDEYEFLNDNPPQFCFSNISYGTSPYDNNEGKYKNYNMSDTIIPYENKLLMYVPPKPEEEDYLWNRTLENCEIKEKYSSENQEKYFSLIERRMEDIYFGGSPRGKVAMEPPFKYTPEYFGK